MRKTTRIFAFLLAICSLGTVLSSCGHKHAFEEKWTANAGYHWKAAVCGHGDAIEAEPHVSGGGRMVNGAFMQTCGVCAAEYRDDAMTALFERGTEAVLITAQAYLNKKGLLEYDQFNSRRQMFLSPEEATEQSYGYLDCSSYVASVYYNTFGIRLIPEAYGSHSTKNFTKYAKENLGKSADVIGYYETQDYATAEAQKAAMEEIKAMLLPGDIIVYRRGAKGKGKDYNDADLTGHAILYMGDNKFSHCTGTSYNDGGTVAKQQYKDDPESGADRATGEEYSGGSVMWLEGSSVLAVGSGSRMLFGEKKSICIYNFSILRPMQQGGTVPVLTEQAEKRMQIPELTCEITSDAGLESAVCVGDTVTYTLKIKNQSNSEVGSVSLKAILPEGVTFVESNTPLAQNGRELTAELSFARYVTKTVSFTVRVNAGTAAGTVLAFQSEVGGLKMKELRNTVSRYSRETLAAIAAKARECAESGMAFSDPMAFVSHVFSEVLGSDPFGARSAQEVLSEIFEVQSETKSVLKENGAFASMVAKNLYGGASHASAYSANNDLVRTVRAHNLTEGDVILCRWGGGVRVYVYLGGGALAEIDTLQPTCELKENGSEEWVKVKEDGSTYYYQRHLLGSLFAYESYAVLR